MIAAIDCGLGRILSAMERHADAAMDDYADSEPGDPREIPLLVAAQRARMAVNAFTHTFGAYARAQLLDNQAGAR